MDVATIIFTIVAVSAIGFALGFLFRKIQSERTILSAKNQASKIISDAQELAEFQRDSNIFTILFLVFIIIPIPLVLWLGWLGMGIFLAVWIILMYYARRIEKYKKKYDIQTFKEIIAFTQGESLDELEKVAEVAKRPYQKPIIVAFVCLVTLIVSVLILAMAKLFSLI